MGGNVKDTDPQATGVPPLDPVAEDEASQKTVEIAKQLRGEAGERQVPDADVGLTHNVGGIGQYCFVQVLKRD